MARKTGPQQIIGLKIFTVTSKGRCRPVNKSATQKTCGSRLPVHKKAAPTGGSIQLSHTPQERSRGLRLGLALRPPPSGGFALQFQIAGATSTLLDFLVLFAHNAD
jgi:hypothetical protein